MSTHLLTMTDKRTYWGSEELLTIGGRTYTATLALGIGGLADVGSMIVNDPRGVPAALPAAIGDTVIMRGKIFTIARIPLVGGRKQDTILILSLINP